MKQTNPEKTVKIGKKSNPLTKGVILKSVKKEYPSVFFQFAPDTDATLAAALI